MGFMDRLVGGQGQRGEPADYVELDIDDFEASATETGTRIHVAKIDSTRDVGPIKDAVYDGNIVIADISPRATRDRTMERVSAELQQVAEEVGGDIVQKDDDQLIITAAGTSVARKRLGR
ncbi:hypothetical protein BRD01_06945 [Halobacteriales archaeon QS_8_65_32]|jgi:SepF-like predicted cell division protein (DUF552 family)|nr:MAG: hypothetical protein BRD01_06945 [Halobacteriales archaeon QS_8_65_32]